MMSDRCAPTGGRAPAQHLLRREARRLLPVLARPNAFACIWNGRGASAAPGETVAVLTRRDQKRPSALAETSTFKALAVENWVEASDDDIWRISENGRAWLARRHDADSFADQHRIIESASIRAPDGTEMTARVNAGEDPLGWLARRRDAAGRPLLSKEMVEAGERLRADFTRANLVGGLTTDWSAIARRQSGRRLRRSASQHGISDSALAARLRLHRALDTLGPSAAGLVMDVCCFLTGLEQAERNRGWSRRSGKVVLRVALEQLVRHYRIAARNDRKGPD